MDKEIVFKNNVNIAKELLKKNASIDWMPVCILWCFMTEEGKTRYTSISPSDWEWEWLSEL